MKKQILSLLAQSSAYVALATSDNSIVFGFIVEQGDCFAVQAHKLYSICFPATSVSDIVFTIDSCNVQTTRIQLAKP